MADPSSQSQLVLVTIAVLFGMCIVGIFVFAFLRWHYSTERRDRIRAAIAAVEGEKNP